jgi:hypothetical protein
MSLADATGMVAVVIPDALGAEIILAAVPEFEPAYRELLSEEDGDIGSFQFMSWFAEWVLARPQSGQECGAIERAFEVIERFIVDSSIRLGDALAAEFIEATWRDSTALSAMGPNTRARVGD